MEHTVSDADRRLDGPARMEPGGSGDVECRQPIPGPKPVLARLVGCVDFTVRPITAAPREAAEDRGRA